MKIRGRGGGTILNWSAWGDLHSQGCSILSRIGLLFPINHTPDWSATRDLHPEGSAILSRGGLLFPLRPVAAKWLAAPKLANTQTVKPTSALPRFGAAVLLWLRSERRLVGMKGLAPPR